MADRKMYRYVVLIADQPHVVPLIGDQPHVVPLIGDPVAVAAIGAWSVEFWAEHDERAGCRDRAFQVFGTGHPLPDGARWVGTCPRTEDGLVWHLFEISAGGNDSPS